MAELGQIPPSLWSQAAVCCTAETEIETEPLRDFPGGSIFAIERCPTRTARQHPPFVDPPAIPPRRFCLSARRCHGGVVVCAGALSAGRRRDADERATADRPVRRLVHLDRGGHFPPDRALSR